MSILPGVREEHTRVHAEDLVRVARVAARLTSASAATVVVRSTVIRSTVVRDTVVRDTVVHDTASAGESVCAEWTRAARDELCRRVIDRNGPGVVTATDPDMLCVPLRGQGPAEGRTVGAICVVDHPGRDWSDDDVAALIDIAELSAAGLAVRELAAEREQVLGSVERDNAFLNAVLENLADGVAACDRDGSLVYFNPALREIHGLPEHASTADDWADAYDLFDATGERPLDAAEIPLARAFAGQPVRNEHMVVRTRQREAQHFLATGSSIHANDGSKLGAVVSMRDITSDHRRRLVRSAHLAVATALAGNPGGDEAIATAMLHLRGVLEPAAAGVVMLGADVDEDIDDRVVRAVARSGQPLQAALDPPYSGYVACTPIVVASATVGVLYLAGPSGTLLDELSESIIEGVAALLGRCLERERSERLGRELRSARHDLERVIEHAQDYVWTVELLPSGRMSLRATTSPHGILGGGADPGGDGWLDLLKARVVEQDIPALVRWREDLLRGRPGEFTCRLRGDDDVVRSIRTRCVLRVEDGRRYIDGVSGDVTGNVRFGPPIGARAGAV